MEVAERRRDQVRGVTLTSIRCRNGGRNKGINGEADELHKRGKGRSGGRKRKVALV